MGKDSAEFAPSRAPAAEPSARPGPPAVLVVGTVFIGGLIFAEVQWGVLGRLLIKPPAPVAVESPAPEVKAETPRAARSQTVRSRPRSRREGPFLAQARSPAEPAPATAASRPAVRARRFPSATDIEAGMSALSIRQAFGTPDMQMSGFEHGRFVERWVYMSQELAAETTVLLSESKAVSAHTAARH